ncbi:hypothetical protein JOM56_007233 [Amanita muscaria]
MTSSGPSSSSSDASGRSVSSSNSFPLPSSLSKMKETIRDNLYEHVPVEEFVEHVWGTRSSDIERILDGKYYWNVPQSILRNYKQAYGRMNENSLAARRAGNVFAAFLDIVEEVLQDIRLRLNDAVRPTNTVAFKYNVDCSKADIPDIATVWDATSKPDWAVIQTMFEFERPSMPQLGDDSGDIAMASSEEGSVSENTSSYPSCSSSRSSTRDSLSSSTSATSSCATNASYASSKAGSYQNEKRHRGSRSITSRRRRGRINKGELRLAQKVLECLSSSCRRSMTGIYVDGCSVTLWYYDRMSAIRSRPFDFEHRPSYLALVLYAISRCGIHQAGYDPFHEFSNTRFGAQIPATTLKSSRLVIPSSGASYCFQITRDKLIYSSHELLGRGTKVYPVILQPDEDEVLINEEEQVLKLYWPNTDDPLEADTIEHLHQHVPEIANYLPSISFSASFTRDELGLPSSRLESYASSDPENRLLHVFTTRRYDKLWEVNSVEEFQEVFLDCVECHYLAYWKGYVLHRDLSENNLMVWRPRRGGTVGSPGSTSPSSHTRAFGILNDWDMATHIAQYSGVASVVTMVTNDPSPEVDALKNRTGTVPFMALDLLTDDGPTPRHLYRHDLESFLWILIWAAVHYDIPNKRNLSAIPGKIDKELKIWDQGTREEVWACKRALLRRVSGGSSRCSNDGDLTDVLDRVRPEFQKLKSEWIIPLIHLFYRAYNELRYTDVDEETCGGLVTFATFMAALKRTPRLATSSSEDGWSSCIIV